MNNCMPRLQVTYVKWTNSYSFTHKEIKNLNRQTHIVVGKKIKSVIKSLPTKKNPEPELVNSTKHLKTTNPFKGLQKADEGTLPNSS